MVHSLQGAASRPTEPVVCSTQGCRGTVPWRFGGERSKTSSVIRLRRRIRLLDGDRELELEGPNTRQHGDHHVAMAKIQPAWRPALNQATTHTSTRSTTDARTMAVGTQ